jgi:uncharacterized protein
MLKITKALWVIPGHIFLVIGVAGTLLPIIPGTIFLLLAAACYFRGSDKFYNWLLDNKYFGKQIRDTREGRGLPLYLKLGTVFFFCGAIAVSLAFIIHNIFIKIFMILMAIGFSAYILSIKTYKEKKT